LFVEKATVLFATRNFKVLTLHEILVLHKVENAERLVPTDPHLGVGASLFVQTSPTAVHASGQEDARLSWRRRGAPALEERRVARAPHLVRPSTLRSISLCVLHF